MAPTVADLELQSAQLEKLQEALVSAFPSRFAFTQFAQYKLDLDLDRLVSDVGLDQVAFELIGWARSEGRLAQIIAAARAENPGNPELKAFADRVGIQALVAPDAPSAAAANRGLTALQELMDTANARDEVRAFEAEFQAAVEQIEVLGILKDVHDLLHTLQFRCYDGLARQTPRSRPTSWPGKSSSSMASPSRRPSCDSMSSRPTAPSTMASRGGSVTSVMRAPMYRLHWTPTAAIP